MAGAGRSLTAYPAMAPNVRVAEGKFVDVLQEAFDSESSLVQVECEPSNREKF